MKDQDLLWHDDEIKKINKCRVFDLMCATRHSEDGMKSNFYYLNANNWVTIIPIYKNDQNIDEFVMVRQFRHGDQQIYTEFPAGIMEKNENPEVAALRELEEETGFTGKLTFIGKLNPNPAILNNTNYTFLAEDLKPLKQGQKLDEEERLHVVHMNIREVGRYMGIAPEFSHAIMVQAYYYYLRYRSQITY